MHYGLTFKERSRTFFLGYNSDKDRRLQLVFQQQMHDKRLFLTKDLKWVSNVDVGDNVFSFTKNPIFNNNKSCSRRYFISRVVSKQSVSEPGFIIKTSSGETLLVHEGDKILGYLKNRCLDNIFSDPAEIIRDGHKYPRGAGLAWRIADQLRPGENLIHFSDTWNYEDTREAGWLEGIFDGEGCVSRSTPTIARIPAWKVNISQNSGVILERIKRELESRNYTYYLNIRACPQVVLNGGWVEVLRFLGSVRPARLLLKINEITSNMPVLSNDRTYKKVIVESITKENNLSLNKIITESNSIIVNGYLCHC